MDQPTPQPDLAELTHPHLGRQPLNSISTRIIFFVFLSTFLTALVVSWISIHTIHQHLRQGVEAHFPAVLDRRIERIDAWLVRASSQLEEIAQESGLPKKRWGSPSKAVYGKRLDEWLEGSPRFSALALPDRRGRLVTHTRGISQADLNEVTARLLAGSENRRYVAGTNAAGQPFALTRITLPQEAEDAPTMLLGIYRHESMASLLPLQRDERPGRVLLLSRDGTPVIDPGGSSAGAEHPIPLERLLQSTSNVREYTNGDGHHVLGSARSLDHLDWWVVMEAPFDQVFAPVLSVVTRIFLSDLAIILLFSFLAYKITAAIMQPIEALSEGATRISHGDIEHEIPTPKSNDEIGLLTRTFNDMMHKLRENKQEIEQEKSKLKVQNDELQRANEVLAQLSITDGLTKLHNHRYFQDHLTREIKRLSRTGDQLSMILLDLDDFKRLNDRYGHAAGDEVLMGIAALMNDSVRECDLLARYGGEEFVILAPGTEIEGAVSLAEKIRMAVEESSQIIDDSMRPVKVTVSCGVAQYDGDRKAFFLEADRALYRAKAEGKNCVITSDGIG
jgi:diguanylate cyclase (GGDEF)-like protein